MQTSRLRRVRHGGSNRQVYYHSIFRDRGVAGQLQRLVKYHRFRVTSFLYWIGNNFAPPR